MTTQLTGTILGRKKMSFIPSFELIDIEKINKGTLNAIETIFDAFKNKVVYGVEKGEYLEIMLKDIPSGSLEKMQNWKGYFWEGLNFQYIRGKFLKIKGRGHLLKINVFEDFLADREDTEPLHFNDFMQSFVEEEKKIYELCALPYAFKFYKWHSISARAGLFLEAENILQYYPRVRGLRAYYGGRIEQAYQGEYKGDLYQYDVHAAYPYAMANLFSFIGKLHKIKKYQKEAYGFYKIFFNFEKGRAYYPFPLRRDKELYFPKKGLTWVSCFELEAYTSLYGWKGIRLISGYVLEHNKEKNKFQEDLEKLYSYRTASPSHFIKKFMACFYGKTIQTQGRSASYNSFYAGLVTGSARASLIPYLSKDVISILTDSFISTAPLNIFPSSDLGGWEIKTWDKGLFIKSGIYHLENKETSIDKLQGFQIKNINLETMFEEALKTGYFYSSFEKWTNKGLKTITVKNSLNLKKRLAGKPSGAALQYYAPAINYAFWKISEEYLPKSSE